MFSYVKFLWSGDVLLLLSGDFDYLKSVWKGVKFVLFCLHMRNLYSIDFIESFIVNVSDLLVNFIQLDRLLTVCINRSKNPIAL